jgi:hypothetical protein
VNERPNTCVGSAPPKKHVYVRASTHEVEKPRGGSQDDREPSATSSGGQCDLSVGCGDEMSTYRTPLNDFILDQIGFVECKLNDAIRDAASQIAATIEASGVVPQLRERMFSEDQGKATQCVLACPELFDLNWWNELAVIDRTQFLSKASSLLGKFAKVKGLFGSQ